MNDSDKNVYDDRFEKLKKLITKEFPLDRYKINFKEIIYQLEFYLLKQGEKDLLELILELPKNS
jgi:hypothetical protein